MAGVKKTSIKARLAKEAVKDALAALMNMRMQGTASPAELFFGRQKLRNHLPSLHKKFDRELEEGKREARKAKYMERDEGKRSSPKFEVGDKVWAQDIKTGRWNIGGTISGVRERGMSYMVMYEHGGEFLRNHKYLMEGKDGVFEAIV